jgi:hypothetical protein
MKAPSQVSRMGSENVVWIMPAVVLGFGYIYAMILGIGTVYGFMKYQRFTALVRDGAIVALVIVSSHLGLTTGHSVLGLLGIGTSAGISLSMHSSEFGKTQDMAPYGHLTAIGLITVLLVISGLLTSEY